MELNGSGGRGDERRGRTREGKCMENHRGGWANRGTDKEDTYKMNTSNYARYVQ